MLGPVSENPYERFRGEELILRDELAIDRTILANERTLLAYLRGAVSLVIAGATFMHFVPAGYMHTLGLALLPLGLATGVFGALRHRAMDRRIRATRAKLSRKAPSA